MSRRRARRTGRRASHGHLGSAGVGVWATPTLDVKRRRLYVATGNKLQPASHPVERNSVVALDLDSGRIVWSTQALPTPSTIPRVRPRQGADLHGRQRARLRLRSPCCWWPPTAATCSWPPEIGIVWALRSRQERRRRVAAAGRQGGINGGVQWGWQRRRTCVRRDVGRGVARTATTRVLDSKSGGRLTACAAAWLAALARRARSVRQPRQLQPGAVGGADHDRRVVFSGSLAASACLHGRHRRVILGFRNRRARSTPSTASRRPAGPSTAGGRGRQRQSVRHSGYPGTGACGQSAARVCAMSTTMGTSGLGTGTGLRDWTNVPARTHGGRGSTGGVTPAAL